MSEKTTDNRQEYRLHKTATVFIEVASESFDGSEPSEILISNSVDLSANGLQITADTPLLINSIHQAAIKIDNVSKRMVLTVQVRWVSLNDEDHQYHIGLEVLDDSDSNLSDWKMDLSNRLMDDFDSE